MNDPGNNHIGALFRQRLLSNLAISLERKFLPGIDREIEGQELQVSLEALMDPLLNPFKLENLLDSGLEHPVERLANVLMPFPRLLYATLNLGFAPAAATADLDRFINRLDAFHNAPGQIPLPSIPAGTSPLENPCTIPLELDPQQPTDFPARSLHQGVAAADHDHAQRHRGRHQRVRLPRPRPLAAPGPAQSRRHLHHDPALRARVVGRQ
jgi:hypothetical protein